MTYFSKIIVVERRVVLIEGLCVQNQIWAQEEQLSVKQAELTRHQAAIKTAQATQQEVDKQMKYLRANRDKAEKKLKWAMADLKEADKVFKMSENRLLDSFSTACDKQETLLMLQKDFKSVYEEGTFERFIKKFSDLVNTYCHPGGRGSLFIQHTDGEAAAGGDNSMHMSEIGTVQP